MKIVEVRLIILEIFSPFRLEKDVLKESLKTSSHIILSNQFVYAKNFSSVLLQRLLNLELENALLVLGKKPYSKSVCKMQISTSFRFPLYNP